MKREITHVKRMLSELKSKCANSMLQSESVIQVTLRHQYIIDDEWSHNQNFTDMFDDIERVI